MEKKKTTKEVSEVATRCEVSTLYKTGYSFYQYGVTDGEGNFVLPPVYDDNGKMKRYDISFGHERMAQFRMDGKKGFIDGTGKLAILMTEWNVNIFSDGMAVVSKDRKYGCIDKTGKLVIPMEWDQINNFKEGLAWARKGDLRGFIDKTGKLAIPTEYHAEPFCDGLARKRIDKYNLYKCVFIDKTGKEVFSEEWDDAYDFSNGLAAVEKDGKWGYIDKKGKFVIPAEWASAGSFDARGFAAVCDDKAVGLINKKGELVIPCEWDCIDWQRYHPKDCPCVCWQKDCNCWQQFSKIGCGWCDDKAGYYQATKGKGSSGRAIGKSGVIDASGKLIIPAKWQFVYVEDDGSFRGLNKQRYALFDPTGKKIDIPSEFEWKGGCSEGWLIVVKDHKYGYIDKTGQVVIPVQWDGVGSFSEGLAMVKKDDKYGFVDKTGQVVIPVEWVNAKDFSNGLAMVEKDQKCGFVDKTGKIAIPLEWDRAESFRDGYAFVMKNGEEFLIDKTGKIWETPAK